MIGGSFLHGKKGIDCIGRLLCHRLRNRRLYFGLRAGIASLRQRTVDIDLLISRGHWRCARRPTVRRRHAVVPVLIVQRLAGLRPRPRTQRHFIPDGTAPGQSCWCSAAANRLVTLPIERVSIGDRIIVKPGERLPMDGVIVDGEGGIDRASITGESIPVRKVEGRHRLCRYDQHERSFNHRRDRG